jgi:hypothetical protein
LFWKTLWSYGLMELVLPKWTSSYLVVVHASYSHVIMARQIDILHTI